MENLTVVKLFALSIALLLVPSIVFGANILRDTIPRLDDTYFLGNASFRWKNITTANLFADNVSFANISFSFGNATEFMANRIWATEMISTPLLSLRYQNITNVPNFALGAGDGSQGYFPVWYNSSQINASQSLFEKAGKIGIGQESPANELNVIGTGNFTTEVITPLLTLGWPNITNYPTAGAAYQYISVFGDTLSFANISISKQQVTDLITFGNITGAGTSGYFALWDNTTSLNDSSVLFEKAGKIGIGNTIPASLLSVNGTINSTLQLLLPAYGSAGGLVIGTDSNLYRSAANILKTDDSFQAAGGSNSFGATSFSGDVSLGGNDITNMITIKGSNSADLTFQAESSVVSGIGSSIIFTVIDATNNAADVALTLTPVDNGIPFADFGGNEVRNLGAAGNDFGASNTLVATTFSGNVSIGANLLKTTNLVFKELNANSMGIRNAADTGARDLTVRNLYSTSNLVMNANAAIFRGVATNDYYFSIQSMDNGVGLVEVGRVAGAVEPYFSLGGAQNSKFFNNGTVVINETYFRDGKVGIGTTSPAQLLEVAGSAHAIALTDSGDSYNNRAIIGEAGGNGGYFQLYDETETITALIRSYAVGSVQGYFTAGNIGINTTTPTAQLHIISGNGTSALAVDLFSGTVSPSWDAININANANTGLTANNTISWQFDSIGSTAGPAINAIRTSASEADMMFFVTDAEVREEVMRLQGSSGNVGIGTASPTDKLDVEIGETSTGGITVSDPDDIIASIGDGGSVAEAGIVQLYDEGTLDVQIFASSGDSFINSGNVGIGTTSPNSTLHVHTGDSNAASGLDLSQGAVASGRLFFTNGTSGKSFALLKSGDFLQFNSGGTPDSGSGSTLMVLSETGNVGIGTTSPANKLTIEPADASSTEMPTINIKSAGTYGAWRIDLAEVEKTRYAWSTGAGTYIYDVSGVGTSFLKGDGGTSMFIKNDGNVGIGTTQPNSTLHVAGGINVTEPYNITFTNGGKLFANATCTVIFSPDESASTEICNV